MATESGSTIADDAKSEWERPAMIAPTQTSAHSFPRNILSRNLTLAILVISWACSIALIALGAALSGSTNINSPGWKQYRVSRALKEMLPLLINIIVTILTEATGFVHSTTLRWALGAKLMFNSNLRLFSIVPRSWAFGRLANFFGAGFLVLSYAATSIIFANVPAERVCEALPLNGYECDEEVNFDLVYFRPGSVVALGVGLLGLNALATSQYVAIKVVSWSSSPIDAARAAWAIWQREKRLGRCMRAVHDVGEATVPVPPRSRQRTAWGAHAEVRRVLVYLWVLVALTFAWFLSVLIVAQVTARKCQTTSARYYSDDCQNVYRGGSWSLLPDTGGVTSLVKITTVDDAGGTSDTGLNPTAAITVVFLLLMGFQGVMTMGLHCAELLVTMSRDEDTWRRTSSGSGYREMSALWTALGSWKSVLLFVLKPVVHWLFGLAMSFYIGWGIFMRPPQILYLCLSLVVLAVFGTYLCHRAPKGMQPATFGHIQTLINLIDDWCEPMYWGDKGYANGVGHAGTSVCKLPAVVQDRLYALDGTRRKCLTMRQVWDSGEYG